MCTTEYATAAFFTASKSTSRLRAVSFLESVSSSNAGCGAVGSTHAAMVMGPKHAPRPASSTPATGPKPALSKATS